MLGAFGLGVLGGGYLGAVLVGGTMLLVTAGGALTRGESVDSALLIASLAAALGGALGAASGGSAATLSLVAVAMVRRPPGSSIAAGIGAAAGGGISTAALIAAARLLPAAPAIVPIVISLSVAALDAAVAVVVVRASHRSP